MNKLSAGLLVYRFKDDELQVLLVHPGGPFWARKDSWGIPKGLADPGEDMLVAARREFSEELGLPVSQGKIVELGEVKTRAKTIIAFATEADLDVSQIKSNTTQIEWPPRSGQQIEVSEIDKAKYFEVSKAITKMHKGQEQFVERLIENLNYQTQVQPEQASLF